MNRYALIAINQDIWEESAQNKDLDLKEDSQERLNVIIVKELVISLKIARKREENRETIAGQEEIKAIKGISKAQNVTIVTSSDI